MAKVRYVTVAVPASGVNSTPQNLFRGEKFTGKVFRSVSNFIEPSWIEVYSKTEIDSTGLPIPTNGGNYPGSFKSLIAILTTGAQGRGIGTVEGIYDAGAGEVDSYFCVSGDSADTSVQQLVLEIFVP